jgi:hypothetical protein
VAPEPRRLRGKSRGAVASRPRLCGGSASGGLGWQVWLRHPRFRLALLLLYAHVFAFATATTLAGRSATKRVMVLRVYFNDYPATSRYFEGAG